MTSKPSPFSKQGNVFAGANNPFNKDYKPKKTKKKKKRGTRLLVTIEVINQRTGQFLVEVPFPGAIAFAESVADKKGSDDLLFIGLDKEGRSIDSWTLSEVLNGYLML